MDAQSTNPPPPPEHMSDASRPSFARWLTQNLGWAAVLFAGVLLVVASLFFLLSVLLPVGSAPAEPLPGKPTPAVLAATPIPTTTDAQPTAASAEDQEPVATPVSAATDRGYEMVLVPAGVF